MKPPKRKSRVTQKKEAETFYPEKWTQKEKRNLIAALKRFGRRDLNSLQTAVKTKSKEQIEHFMISKSRPNRKMTAERAQMGRRKTPIELWQEMADRLTSHTTDYSASIAQAVSVIGHLEMYEKPVRGTDPDYSLIYRYIAALLANDVPPALSPIESAVLVDVLQNLADRLRSLDTCTQHQLMQLKYQLLLNCPSKDPQSMNIALEDPLELLKPCTSAPRDAGNQAPSSDKPSSLTIAVPAQAPKPCTFTGHSSVGSVPNPRTVSQATIPTASTTTAAAAAAATKDAEQSSKDAEEQKEGSVSTKIKFSGRDGTLLREITIITPTSSKSTSEPSRGSTERAPKDAHLSRQGKNLETKTGRTSSISRGEAPQENRLFSLNPLGIPMKYLNPKPAKGVHLSPLWPQYLSGQQGRNK